MGGTNGLFVQIYPRNDYSLVRVAQSPHSRGSPHSPASGARGHRPGYAAFKLLACVSSRSDSKLVETFVLHLPLLLDLEKAVVGGVVTHLDIAAPFEPVRDGAPVLAIEQPVLKATLRLGDELDQSHSGGLPEFVEDIGKLGVFGRAVGVDNPPEGGRFPRRRLRVEV